MAFGGLWLRGERHMVEVLPAPTAETIRMGEVVEVVPGGRKGRPFRPLFGQRRADQRRARPADETEPRKNARA